MMKSRRLIFYGSILMLNSYVSICTAAPMPLAPYQQLSALGASSYMSSGSEDNLIEGSYSNNYGYGISTSQVVLSGNTPSVSSSASSSNYNTPTYSRSDLYYYFTIESSENVEVQVSFTSALYSFINPSEGVGTSNVESFVQFDISNGESIFRRSLGLSSGYTETSQGDVNGYLTTKVDNVTSTTSYSSFSEYSIYYNDTLTLTSNTMYRIWLWSSTSSKNGVAEGFIDPYINILNNNNDFNLLLSAGVNNIPPTTAPVPEPTTVLLFGSGLAGLAAVGRRRRI